MLTCATLMTSSQSKITHAKEQVLIKSRSKKEFLRFHDLDRNGSNVAGYSDSGDGYEARYDYGQCATRTPLCTKNLLEDIDGLKQPISDLSMQPPAALAFR